MMRTSGFACLVVIFALLAGRTAQLQSQDDAFRNGMRVRSDKQWEALATLMRESIRSDPRESARKVGGFMNVGGKEYLPYLYLGEALFNLGDCPNAFVAWEESERQGVVQKQRAEFKILQDGYAACEAKGFLPLAKSQAAVQRAEAAIADSSAAGHALSEYATAHPEAWRAEFRERHDRARADALAAQEKLNAGRRSRRAGDLAEAATLGERAAAIFKNTRAEVEKAVELLSGLSAAARDVERTIQAAESVDVEIESLLKSTSTRLSAAQAADRQKGRGLLAEARQRVRPAGRQPTSSEIQQGEQLARDAHTVLVPVRAQVAKVAEVARDRELTLAERNTEEAYAFTETQLNAIKQRLLDKPPAADVVARVTPDVTNAETAIARGRRRFDTARRARDLAGVRGAGQVAIDVRPQLDQISALLGLEEIAVPPALMEGARHVFDLRYQEALGMLTEELAQTTPMPLQAHVHALRAAAFFALYVKGGETDSSLRDRARREADECLRLEPAFQPNPAAFSPRFIAFFVVRDQPSR